MTTHKNENLETASVETARAVTRADRQGFKMLNGHCVPVSTPDNYFAVSAAQWLNNLRELVKASRSQQQQNAERERARIEFDANDHAFPSILESAENERRATLSAQ